MVHLRTGVAMPVQPLIVAAVDAAVQGRSGPAAADTTLAARLDAYQACTHQAGSDEWSGSFDAPIGGRSALDMGIPRPRRSSEGVPGSASRESVVGVPLKEDFGAALFAQFRNSGLRTWQRADLIEQAFNEWNSEGPSPRAAKRLQNILAPGYIDTPDERRGDVILDAVALHLIDRGRYAPLVRDYIDALKRSGDYEALIDALLRDYPSQTRVWASTMVETALLIWDEPAPADLRGEGEPADEPAFDLDGRILKLYRIMNADAHTSADAGDDGDDGETDEVSDTATAP